MPVEKSRLAALPLLLLPVVTAALLGSPGCTHRDPEPDAVFEAVRQQAQSVERNNLGHWQADLGDGHVLIYVPAGPFEMGSLEGEAFEQPLHRVELSGYWVGKFPVTVAQFRAFVGETGYVTDAERGEGCWIEQHGDIRYDASWQTPYLDQSEDEPALCVSWNDAMAYAAWMSERTGLHLTLPTEAQWEKAARGTDGRAYPWGDAPPDGSQANFADASYAQKFPGQRNPSTDIDDGYAQASPVGAYPAGGSPYGVYDLAGNTIDWLYDWFDDSYYSESPPTDPAGPPRSLTRHKYSIPGGWGSNLQRSIRGGAWTDASGQLSLAEGGHSIRSDRRESTDQFSSDDHMSFRVAVDMNRPRIDLRTERQTLTLPDERATIAEQIGDAQVMFQYRRAAVTGREKRLFGFDVPYGEPWSIGAPNPALFSCDQDVLVEGQRLVAGTYAIAVFPEQMRDRSGTWSVVFSEWRGRAGTGDEVLRVRAHAQLEDNSKEHLEVFFDVRPERGVIARVLWEFVEVHIALSDLDDTAAGRHAESEPEAMVINAVGNRELALTYRRQFSPTAPVFGGHVPFDRAWGFGEDGAVLEARGDLLLGGELVRAGRYGLSLTPRSEGNWWFTLSPVAGQSESLTPVTFAATVTDGEESIERLELYFDHGPEGMKSLVLAWGKKTAQVSVAEPAAGGSALSLNEKGYWEANLGGEAPGIKAILVPEGCFPMGSEVGEEDERPVHEVCLDAYWLGKYPVTVGQFRRFVEETGYVTDAEKGEWPWQYVGGKPPEMDQWEPVPDGKWSNTYFEQGDDHPVVSVSWNDAAAYAKWLSGELGLPVQRPTEAQWEHGARGEDGRPYPWGTAAPDGTRANFADAHFHGKYGDEREADPAIDDGYVETSPVDEYPAGQSPYGAFDMAGNASEWVYDWYDPDYYASSPSGNPIGPERYPVRDKQYSEEDPLLWDSNLLRVMRSEAWTARSGMLSVEGGHNIRSAERSVGQQYSSDDHLGFRLVIDPRPRYPALLTDTRIAFHADGDGDDEIYVVDPTGLNLVKLTDNEGVQDRNPVWSANAHEIIFWSDRDGDGAHYILNIDTGEVRPWNMGDASDATARDAAMAPDGTKIARAQVEEDGTIGLYHMEPNGENPMPVVRGLGRIDGIAWSPYQP